MFSVADNFRHAEDPSNNLAGTMPGHDRLPTALPRVSHPGGDVSSPTGQRVGILLPAESVRTLCQVITYIGLSMVLQALTLTMPNSSTSAIQECIKFQRRSVRPYVSEISGMLCCYEKFILMI
jgi:hypothetical protein